MALERLSLAPTLVDADEDAVTNGGGQTAVDACGDDGGRAPRLPRWTRQEIMVLIQGKKAAENRVRRGRVMGVGSVQVVEPKWAWVASYCRQRGVNRGPVQCRKRWSNLAGDYKKIKEWESAQAGEEAESFWVMRNDLRRERKLPGFFDREVYDILDGSGTPAATVTPTGLDLALAPSAGDAAEEDGKEAEEVAGEEVEAEAEALFDSGRSAAAEDGLFSDFEQEAAPEKEFATATSSLPAPIPISEKQYRPFSRVCSSQGAAAHGTQQTSNPEVGATSEEGRKRKRFAAAEGDDEEANTLQYQLIQVLERNGRMLSAQLEAQNTHLQLDREQRKGHMDSIVAALDKLAGALGRIADKL